MFRPAGLSDESGSDDESYFDKKFSSNDMKIVDDMIKQNITEDEENNNVVAEDETETLTAIAKFDLIQAIEAGDVDSVTSLVDVVGIEAPLDVWGWSRVACTGLACCFAQDKVLQYLLQRGGHCDRQGFLLLTGAEAMSQRGDVIKCAELLKEVEEEDVNQVQVQGMTPLMLACKNGKKHLVQWMLVNEAKVNVVENHGWTPLMFSVDSGHGDIARILLNSGADPDHINNNGQTAADIAATADRTVLQDIIESFAVDGGRTKPRPTISVTETSKMDNLLSSLKLDHIIQIFHENKVDFETFLILKEADVGKLVNNIGDCKKLLSSQAELHKAEWSNSSLPSIKSEQRRDGLVLDTPVATTMLGNISQHARYMKLNIGFIRSQLRDHQDRFLQAGADLVQPYKLLTQARGGLNHINHLYRELELLHQELQSYDRIKKQMNVDSVQIETEYDKAKLLKIFCSTLLFGSLCIFLKKNL